VDRLFQNHYASDMVSETQLAVAMTGAGRFTAALVALMFFALAAVAVPAAPVIMVLEHVQNGERFQTPVEAIPDLITSPHAGKGQLKWSILPGEIGRASCRERV
jgi:hypothetical protein